MHNLIEYISPSSFYYWERCPLKAVFSKKYRDMNIFPNHPDADLGILIHKFYEKHNEWSINSAESFDTKWNFEIKAINKHYKNNSLQRRYYPIQWHSKYYSVKKQLLLKNIISIKRKTESSSSNRLFTYEEWISNQYIGGYVDLIIKENNEIKQIIDFKTGNIFDIVKNQRTIKEIYKQQLALYCAIIIEIQHSIPNLFIETIDGKRFKIDINNDYISEIASRASLLKNKINNAIKSKKISLLANCNIDNCYNCNYRMVCNIYKNILINERCVNKIDLVGEVIKTNLSEIKIDIETNIYTIKNAEVLKDLKQGQHVSIFNLFYPNEENDVLYCMNNTIAYNE